MLCFTCGERKLCSIIKSPKHDEHVGPLLFLTFINDLSYNSTSNAKPFADDTSLFSVVHDINTAVQVLNDDLKKS